MNEDNTPVPTPCMNIQTKEIKYFDMYSAKEVDISILPVELQIIAKFANVRFLYCGNIK